MMMPIDSREKLIAELGDALDAANEAVGRSSTICSSSGIVRT